MSPLNRRRIANFKGNRRGYISLYIFLILFSLSIFSEFFANDKPILIYFDGSFLFPVVKFYPETRFGGEFPTEADYGDPFVVKLIEGKGWAIWPLIPYSYDTVAFGRPAPASPSKENWLGTDDQSRDVLARLIYGFRISLLFALILTSFSSIIGGWIDLLFQRFMEIWQSMPRVYLLIILASVVQPSFWWLIGILLLFNWMGYVGVVRAEFLRARNFDFVRAARGLGVSNIVIMYKHVLPNAMVATITFLPFNLGGAVTLLTGLDFLGFGLPPGSASLGEMVTQGRNNLHAPWLGLTSFITLAIMLILLIFIGEAVRDAFDPRKTLATSKE